MKRYAEGTDVPVEKSRAEIEVTLRRYGATGFISGWNEDHAMLGFSMQGRQVKFVLPLPSRSSKDFTHFRHSSGKLLPRTADAATRAWEQACRQRWRALALVIKAKLEAVAAGITVFEDEFLAHIVLPDGQTVSQHVRPAIASAYDTGKMPPLLPYYGEGNA